MSVKQRINLKFLVCLGKIPTEALKLQKKANFALVCKLCVKMKPFSHVLALLIVSLDKLILSLSVLWTSQPVSFVAMFIHFHALKSFK